MNANIRLVLMGLVAAAAVSGTIYLYSTTWADEQQLAQCRSGSGKARIDGCTAVVKSGKTEKNDLADAYFYRGYENDRLKQHKRAIADYDQAITLRPGNSMTFNNRGFSYDELGDSAHAVQDCDKAIRLDPGNTRALNNRGNLYLRFGDPLRAIKDYDAVLRLTPDKIDTLANRGWAYSALGQHQRAMQDFDKVVGKNPGTVTYNLRCWARATWGEQLDAALADCNRALKLKPDNFAALDSRALVYFRMGKYAEAIADDDSALAKVPRLPPSLYVRGLAKLRMGDTAGGNADIAAAKKLDPKIEGEYAKYGLKP
jgi:tetratricopeptide (TPR) repeat protein